MQRRANQFVTAIGVIMGGPTASWFASQTDDDEKAKADFESYQAHRSLNQMAPPTR